MRERIRLGHIAGVRISLDISALAIAAILIFGLSFGRFPAVFPGRPIAEYIIAGIAATVLFLASLLTHELAHSVAARSNGIAVSGITLWLLGGVSELRGEPREPSTQLRIAAAGPLASVAAAAVFATVAAEISVFVGHGLATGVFAYLAGINLILAVFNLIPAAPLDGGALLRAFLWRRSGDQAKAAVTAARAGRGTGYALIALGMLQVVASRSFQGLWLVIIGLFLVNAATAEEQQAKAGIALHGVRAGDVMTPHPVTAGASGSVAAFIDEVALAHRFSTYPLLDSQGQLAGLITLNRLRSVPAEQRSRVAVRDVACPAAQVPVTSAQEPLTGLLSQMAGCADGRAVVLDDDARVVGVVTPSDISRALQASDLRGIQPYPIPRGADVTVPKEQRHAA